MVGTEVEITFFQKMSVKEMSRADLNGHMKQKMPGVKTKELNTKERKAKDQGVGA